MNGITIRLEPESGEAQLCRELVPNAKADGAHLGIPSFLASRVNGTSVGEIALRLGLAQLVERYQGLKAEAAAIRERPSRPAAARPLEADKEEQTA